MVMLPSGAVENRGQQKEALAGVMFDKVRGLHNVVCLPESSITASC
jgi:hypothetical protein